MFPSYYARDKDVWYLLLVGIPILSILSIALLIVAERPVSGRMKK